jgi:hypothetical protein
MKWNKTVKKILFTNSRPIRAIQEVIYKNSKAQYKTIIIYIIYLKADKNNLVPQLIKAFPNEPIHRKKNMSYLQIRENRRNYY